MWNDAIADRRSTPRRASTGVLVVRMHGRVLRGTIADLSSSGVRVNVESRVGLDGLDNRKVGIELRLVGRGPGWLYLRGRVVRVSFSLLTFVVAFDNVPTELADFMDLEDRDSVLH